MEHISSHSRVVPRKSGGWLALTAVTDSLKIGVSAPTEVEAKERLAITTAHWRRLLAADREQPDGAPKACS